VSDVSTTISAHSSGFYVKSEMVPETLVIFNKLTWLVAQEDFIKYNYTIFQLILINNYPDRNLYVYSMFPPAKA
jgi:hypothetical protein